MVFLSGRTLVTPGETRRWRRVLDAGRRGVRNLETGWQRWRPVQSRCCSADYVVTIRPRGATAVGLQLSETPFSGGSAARTWIGVRPGEVQFRLESTRPHVADSLTGHSREPGALCFFLLQGRCTSSHPWMHNGKRVVRIGRSRTSIRLPARGAHSAADRLPPSGSAPERVEAAASDPQPDSEFFRPRWGAVSDARVARGKVEAWLVLSWLALRHG